jgi:DNA-binding transcriptional LysR family regulator
MTGRLSIRKHSRRAQSAALTPLVAYLEEVAQQGSIRRAAEALHISPSSINRQIIKFEESLGVQLFERLPRGLRLTSAGEELLGTLRRMSKDYAHALDNIDALKGLHRGHVGIAVPQQMAESPLGSVLRAVHAKHPGIRYTVLVGTTDQIMAWLASDQADIGLCLAPSGPAPVQIVMATQLTIGVVMRPDHPLAGKKSLKFGQCLGYPMALPSAQMQARKLLDQVLWRMNARVSPLIETDSITFMRQAVQQLDCIAFMTMADAAPDVAAGRLAYARLADQSLPESTTALFIRAGRSLPLAAELVLDHLKAGFPFFDRPAK